MLSYLEKKCATKSDKWIYLVHGYGSNKEDLYSLGSFLQGFNIVSIEAPLTLGHSSYSWFSIYFDEDGVKDYNTDEYTQSLSLLNDFVSDHKKKNNLSTENCYILGFSQGGAMALGLGLEYNTLVQKTVLCSAVIHPKLHDLSKIIDHKLNVLQIHGTVDMVVPHSLAVSGQKMMENHPKKINLKSKYYTDGHTINHDMLKDINSWLQEN